MSQMPSVQESAERGDLVMLGMSCALFGLAQKVLPGIVSLWGSFCWLIGSSCWGPLNVPVHLPVPWALMRPLSPVRSLLGAHLFVGIQAYPRCQPAHVHHPSSRWETLSGTITLELECDCLHLSLQYEDAACFIVIFSPTGDMGDLASLSWSSVGSADQSTANWKKIIY